MVANPAATARPRHPFAVVHDARLDRPAPVTCSSRNLVAVLRTETGLKSGVIIATDARLFWRAGSLHK
jgi:hypothetical protein